jgi:NADPH-dependent 2,4-dienoyl-CoA reductase/sulfur reductase-like enzyme
VVVVGGGPAGLEAARVAALRGHHVVLFEAGAQLGGQVLLAARAPHREEYIGNARWLERQIALMERVEVRLHRAAGVEDVLALEPDAVIVATGARPARPALPGLDGPRVQDAETVFAQVTGRSGDSSPLLGLAGEEAPALMPGSASRPANRGLQPASARLHSLGLPERAHVVVVDEEGYVKGLGAADLLASLGCRVEFVTSQYMPGQQLPDMVRAPILRRCYGNHVHFHPNLVLAGMDGSSVRFRQFFAEDELVVEGVDLLVLAFPPRAEDTLARALKGRVAHLRAIGDCVAPRGVASAILEGTLAGRAV